MARGNGSGVSSGSGETVGTGNGNIIDPIDVDRANQQSEISVEPEQVSGTGSAPTGKRRGRKPGSASQKAAVSVEGVEAVLLSLHYMAAAAFKVPEMQLGKPEAAALAASINNVARHYPTFKTTQQTIDWIMLVTVLCSVYGTRVVAYQTRVTKAKREAAKAGEVVSGPWRGPLDPPPVDAPVA